jgi:predicted dehydrogenase
MATQESNNSLNRRAFIKMAAGAAAGMAAAPKKANAGIATKLFPQTVLGANERILTGHIGTGRMGMRNLGFCTLLREQKDIQPIAICDLVEDHREGAADFTTRVFDRPSTHEYFEDVLENKDVDAVVIVTPDHWHTIPSIMACDAGKDVWCEKPLTTTIGEGQPLIDAVRRNKTVLQCGNFQRSGGHFKEVVDLIQSGYIGKIPRVETWIHDSTPAAGIGNPPDEPVPDGLDWDRYLGWTEKVPYNKNRHLYNFRWFLNYSGGKMTDWGAHLIDIVLWAMGEEKKPKAISAMGGKFVLEDNRTTPDTLEVLYDFDDYILSFSNRVYNGYVKGNRYGIRFYGSKGTLYVDRRGYKIEPVLGGCEPRELGGQVEGDMNKAHWQNFVDCIKSRKDPICYAESAFNTAAVCHMGTTAYVAGGHFGWDADKQRFTSPDRKAEKKANNWAYREYQNGWSLKAPYYKGWKA